MGRRAAAAGLTQPTSRSLGFSSCAEVRQSSTPTSLHLQRLHLSCSPSLLLRFRLLSTARVRLSLSFVSPPSFFRFGSPHLLLLLPSPLAPKRRAEQLHTHTQNKKRPLSVAFSLSSFCSFLRVSRNAAPLVSFHHSSLVFRLLNVFFSCLLFAPRFSEAPTHRHRHRHRQTAVTGFPPRSSPFLPCRLHSFTHLLPSLLRALFVLPSLPLSHPAAVSDGTLSFFFRSSRRAIFLCVGV